MFESTKKKRPASPAESNTSFMKKVTSTMASFLPSAITKWITPSQDSTNAFSDEDILEFSGEPPPKRRRFSGRQTGSKPQDSVSYCPSARQTYQTYSPYLEGISSNPRRHNVNEMSTKDFLDILFENERRNRRTFRDVSTNTHTKCSSMERRREPRVIKTPSDKHVLTPMHSKTSSKEREEETKLINTPTDKNRSTPMHSEASSKEREEEITIINTPTDNNVSTPMHSKTSSKEREEETKLINTPTDKIGSKPTHTELSSKEREEESTSINNPTDKNVSTPILTEPSSKEREEETTLIKTPTNKNVSTPMHTNYCIWKRKMKPTLEKTPINKNSSTPMHIKPSSREREKETEVITTSNESKSTVTDKRKYDVLDMIPTEEHIKEKIRKLNDGDGKNYSHQSNFNASLTGCPFYQEKLEYGGSATLYMNRPNIMISKATKVNKTSNQNLNVGESVKRVMDLLENLVSPLSDVKRISPHVSYEKNISYSKSMENTDWHNGTMDNLEQRKPSFKTQMLLVPNTGTILSLKRRSRLMDTTQRARQIIASQSSTINYTPFPRNKPHSEALHKDNNDKLTTKIKNKVTRTERKYLVKDLPTPINVPTAVLKIDKNNLPKFNFGNPSGSTSIQANNESTKNMPIASSKSAKQKDLCEDMQTSEVKPSNDSDLNKFAVPGKEKDSNMSLQELNSQDPIQELDTTDDNEIKISSQISIKEHTIKSNTAEPKHWKCSDCWVNNKPDSSNCVCCSAKRSEENTGNKKCSFCQSVVIEDQNECTKCKETQQSNCNTLPLLNSLQNSKTWRCGDCWVDNAETAEKCVCCGSKNPKLSETIEKQENTNASDWKCNDCWIKNRHTIEKCVACGGAKPNSASNNTTVMSLVVKDQVNKWECSNCLVRNDNDRAKCVCCEAEKSGPIKEVTFKFGMDKAMAVKFNKHTEPQQTLGQSFTFGLPVNNTKNSLPVAVSNEIEAPKLNFTFGIPKQITSQSTNQTAINILEFNTKEKECVPVAEEKPQEVPTIVFNTLTPTKNISHPKNTFESSKSPQESLSKIANPTSTSGVTEMVREEKSIGFKPIIVQTVSDSTFTFGQSESKFTSNLFSASTPIVANVSSANNSGIIPGPITISPSLFQKNDLNVNSSVGLFQRVESSPSNTNIFKNPATTSNEICFGRKTPSSLPEPSQPKFNFSFGNTNKPYLAPTTPIFNATFGIDKEPNANQNSNNFTQSKPNSSGLSPSLPGKSLGTGNFITTGNNPIMSNNASLGNNAITSANVSSVPDLGNNPLNAGNTLNAPSMLSPTPSKGIFGGASQKENIWSNTNNGPGFNMFVSSGPTNSLQRQATFTFGATTSNANNNPGTPFVSNATNAFTSPPQTDQNIYGSAQASNNPPPTMGSFGRPNPTAFNMQKPTMSIFEQQQPQNQFSSPIFNFGTQQSSTPVFGFGQQPQMQFQAPPVYNFGTNTASPQFNMGVAANTTVRRVRKAVRRTQR